MPPDDLSRLVRAPRGAGRLPLGTGSRRAGATGGADEASLTRARVHEVCGPARIVFAAMVAGALERQGEAGPVLWIRAPGAAGGAAPDGLAAFFAPDRVVLALPRRVADALWCAEEALRSGAAALVVVELASPADLTPVRRLHLAAEAGAGAAAAVRGAPPLALLLTPGEGGSQGVESRWRLTPMPTLPPEARDASGAVGHGADRAGPAPSSVGGAAPGDDRRMAPSPPSTGLAARPGERVAGERAWPDAWNVGGAAAGAGGSAHTAAGTAAPGPAAPSRGWAAGGAAVWRLERLRARLAPPRAWRAVWDAPEGAGPPLRLSPPDAEGAPRSRARSGATSSTEPARPSVPHGASGAASGGSPGARSGLPDAAGGLRRRVPDARPRSKTEA